MPLWIILSRVTGPVVYFTSHVLSLVIVFMVSTAFRLACTFGPSVIYSVLQCAIHVAGPALISLLRLVYVVLQASAKGLSLGLQLLMQVRRRHRFAQAITDNSRLVAGQFVHNIYSVGSTMFATLWSFRTHGAVETKL